MPETPDVLSRLQRSLPQADAVLMHPEDVKAVWRYTQSLGGSLVNENEDFAEEGETPSSSGTYINGWPVFKGEHIERGTVQFVAFTSIVSTDPQSDER